MEPVQVMIVAPNNDLHAHAVFDVLKRKRIPTEWLDSYEFNQHLRMTLCLGDVAHAYVSMDSGRRIFLSDVRTIWCRRPRIPELVSEDDIAKDFARSEWEHFFTGVGTLGNIRWVNSPTVNSAAQCKSTQLLAASAEALRIPITRITNDPDAVRELSSKGFQLIYKRLSPGCTPLMITRPLAPKDEDRLDSLHSCPAIFQEQIEAKLDIRVTVIGSEVYAAEIDSQAGDAPLDWRLDYSVPFRSHELDSVTQRKLIALMSRLGLLYGAIDLRLTPEGEYVFLEINPSGQYLFIELLAGIPLTETMASFLAGEIASAERLV